MKKVAPYNLDTTRHNAEWLKTAWDLPTNVTDLRALLARLGMSIPAFKKSTIYTSNITKLPWLKEL